MRDLKRVSENRKATSETLLCSFTRSIHLTDTNKLTRYNLSHTQTYSHDDPPCAPTLMHTRVNGSRAKRSNPNCAVEFNIDEEADHGKAFVDLHFADEDKRRVYLADRRADEITRLMEDKGSELETKSVLKEVRGALH